MSIDISQFHQIFFEESFEGLEGMENALLAVNDGDDDPELINTIFRAAHSIKGGSATFGFTQVAGFTHVMETLLDQVREGEREITSQAIDLFLASVDLLREMLASAQDGEDLEQERVSAVQGQLEQMMGEDGSPSEAVASVVAVDDNEVTVTGWKVGFKPHLDMMRTGNDPVRILREVSSLGEVKVQVDIEKLPVFIDLDPEECYLAWELEVRGDVSHQQIEEIFEWVDEDCDLQIEALAAAVDAPVQEVSYPDEKREDKKDRRQSTDRRSVGVDRRGKKAAVESTSIRVDTDKIDALINMVGELVITQSMLGQIGESMDDYDPAHLEKLRTGLASLERNTREMQESVMRIRMLPISFVFNRFPRLVHDLSAKLGKEIDLQITGEQTELDKTVMEKIGDPLVHIVRNSLDHGIESVEDRVAAGKSEMGTVNLDAYHQGGNIVIRIADDGRGLNKEKLLEKAIERSLISEDDSLDDSEVYALIFHAGFSTAESVSDLSGRGVGMDVVRRNIEELGGSVQIQSELGVGTTIIIRLPLTLAILDGQLVRVGKEIYIVPLIAIIESLQVGKDQLSKIAGDDELYQLRSEYIPVIRVDRMLGTEPDPVKNSDNILVVVEDQGKKSALAVDELLGQQQVVIKNLKVNYQSVEGVSGATILGTGEVALILDITGIVRLSRSGLATKLRVAG
ncbi:MAG: chemotaxis protein CheA [Gammaproteobacteria bacterium]|nr:chemotaxis protein CheA [Gammaproteobacteria bacterium]